MIRRMCARSVLSAGVAILLWAPVQAQVPGEIDGVAFNGSSDMVWNDPGANADVYNVYRGLASDFAEGTPPRCVGARLATASFSASDIPNGGEAFLYLVTGQSNAGEEGTPGDSSGGTPRTLLGSCEQTVRHQILNRVAYGWSEWHRDRLETLGWQGFVDEQLDPATIDESTNTDLITREGVWQPVDDLQELTYLRNDRAIYARRQLERVATEFWQNHLTTYYFKTFEYMAAFFPGDFERTVRASARIHLREEDAFKDIAFNGTFREMIEESTLSAAMMIYLDNVVNIVGQPNENYARELLELHTMGVDNGYDENDIRELSRVFTGWEVCKKALSDLDDPLAGCIDPFFGGQGEFVVNFNVGNHDSGQKILFAGTAYETIIPDTSGNPTEGINDVQIALDAIADRPETAEYISTKLLKRFIVDEPTQPMIDAVVAEWNLTGGDLREVLRAVLAPENLFNPKYTTAKIKTPQDHIYSAYRGLRGNVDPSFVAPLLVNWLAVLDHYPYNRVDPDGYPLRGESWIGTNAMLSRQDFGMTAAVDNFFYRLDIISMVNDYSLSTDEEIVDFFADILFGGRISPAERQRALDYLNTDENGLPSPYDNARIERTVGFMLGYAQFMER